MQKQTVSSNQKSIRRKIFLGFNIIILFCFWFGVVTDFSWSDNWIAIAFPTLASILSLITMFMMRGSSKFQILLAFSLCVLSLLMATLTTFYNFATRHNGNQIPFEVTSSPDRTRIAEVYCLTEIAHGGMDHIQVKVKNIKFPFLSREMGVYNNYPSRNCTFDANRLVRWENNNTIYVVERQAYLDVGFVKLEKALRDPGEIRGTH